MLRPYALLEHVAIDPSRQPCEVLVIVRAASGGHGYGDNTRAPRQAFIIALGDLPALLNELRQMAEMCQPNRRMRLTHSPVVSQPGMKVLSEARLALVEVDPRLASD